MTLHVRARMYAHEHTHTHTHTHTNTYPSSQELRSGKFEMYDYGSAEYNMKHYGVVSVGVCVGRVVESVGYVCV